MTLKSLKPTTSSQRGTVLIDKSAIWKGKPLKSLLVQSKSTGGRNNQGRITSRRIGGRVKRKYREIDFKRNKFNISAEVVRNEYDPNRSSFISLIKYEDGEYRYILSPKINNLSEWSNSFVSINLFWWDRIDERTNVAFSGFLNVPEVGF